MPRQLKPFVPREEQNRGQRPASHGMRAVLYARVSSEEQRERQSIESQVTFAQQWATREGLSLLRVYRDDGVRGTTAFEQRPGGRQLLSDARKGVFDVVLVFKVDRLGRLNIVSHVALHHLESVGVSLRSLTEPFDTSTSQGKFMFSILVANSAMERANICDRTKSGLARVASSGRWPGGRPPYGYRLQDGHVVIEEAEAAVLKEIFSLSWLQVLRHGQSPVRIRG